MPDALVCNLRPEALHHECRGSKDRPRRHPVDSRWSDSCPAVSALTRRKSGLVWRDLRPSPHAASRWNRPKGRGTNRLHDWAVGCRLGSLQAARRFRSYDDFEEIELHSTSLIDKEGRVYWARFGGDPFTDLAFLEKQLKRMNESVAAVAK